MVQSKLDYFWKCQVEDRIIAIWMLNFKEDFLFDMEKREEQIHKLLTKYSNYTRHPAARP